MNEKHIAARVAQSLLAFAMVIVTGLFIQFTMP